MSIGKTKISQYKIFKIGIDKRAVRGYNIGEESERRQAGKAREKSEKRGGSPNEKRSPKKSEEQADVLIYFEYTNEEVYCMKLKNLGISQSKKS